MSFSEQEQGLWRGELNPQVGELGRLWRDFGAEVVIGHPTYHNANNIGRQLAEGIAGAEDSLPGRRVSLVVSDGSWTAASGDITTVEAALQGAKEALRALPKGQRDRVQVIVTPYEGYRGNKVPGKGSALKLLFDELDGSEVKLLVLLDGDLRNHMAQWQRVFAQAEEEHRRLHGDRPLFVTARYARHFVDASLTRFIVGPLTTLMGRYVPGGISGDIVLSAEAVAHERRGVWSEERLRYGTDIATTFDNIAEPQTVIYEVYLGAKLHDITDEGKLSVMPGEVIGSALERLLHWEAVDGRVTRRLRDATATLDPLEVWGPERTGIAFVDPGYTDVFDVDVKINVLLNRFADFAPDIERVQGEAFIDALRERRQALGQLRREGQGPLIFLGLDQPAWIEALQRAVAVVLARPAEVASVKRCLNYLYTAAFLEFVRARLADLGLTTLQAVRQAQERLGVPEAQAETFYRERVDAPVRELALAFYQERQRIVEQLERLAG